MVDICEHEFGLAGPTYTVKATKSDKGVWNNKTKEFEYNIEEVTLEFQICKYCDVVRCTEQ